MSDKSGAEGSFTCLSILKTGGVGLSGSCAPDKSPILNAGPGSNSGLGLNG